MTENTGPETSASKRSHGSAIRVPSAQIPLSGDLVEKLGNAADDYAMALWSTAQQTGADADEMTSLIEEVNEEFGVVFPGQVVNMWQEIFRNSGGLLTVICEDRVLAGGLSDDSARERTDPS